MNGMQKRICALTCCAAMTLSMASGALAEGTAADLRMEYGKCAGCDRGPQGKFVRLL